MGEKFDAVKSAIAAYKMDTKGASGVSKALLSLLMMVIITQLMVSFAPTMFSGLTNITGAPTWVGAVLPILVGAFLVFIIWAVVSKVSN